MRNYPIRGLRSIAALIVVLAAALPGPITAATQSVPKPVHVIVREAPGAGRLPEKLVEASGGEVRRHIRIIRGFTAVVPSGAVAPLRKSPAVESVTVDRRMDLLGASTGPVRVFDPKSDPGSMHNAAEVVKARDMWARGITGRGVDVALIDSGVSPVPGLDVGKVVNGPDLSFDSQSDATRYVDGNGHGTHLAGIIAGRDGGVAAGKEAKDARSFLGIAPDAGIVSVKVATSSGATDVSQVLAAIDWVVQHRRDGGLNIRVLNLAFGTDGVQDYRLDPLTYAVEVAWRKGIVVVVAAGNRGFGNAQLNNPAYDPFVLAVGASDTNGTYPTQDDTVPDWSSRGDGSRNPDLVAPGVSVVSLKSPGSDADLSHPEGHVEARFLRGSGTSQAAAMVSGAAALLLQQRPGLTPDGVKHLLTSTAAPLPAADPVAQGEGLLDLNAAAKAPAPSAVQMWDPATGLGSLDAARGSVRLEAGGTSLSGEVDIFGVAWDPEAWSKTSWSDSSWSGGTWNKTSWSGAGWAGDGWAKTSWSSALWSKTSWSGAAWAKTSWSGGVWSSTSWR